MTSLRLTPHRRGGPLELDEKRAPQKQCRHRDSHIAHHFPNPQGLIYWCQGRGAR